MPTTEHDDLFDKSNEADSPWFKFQKIGDRVSGKLVERSHQPEKEGFQAQEIYHLEQTDGVIMKVAIPVSKVGTISRANSARMGDILGFEFEKEIPAEKKGKHPAKALKVYIKRAVKEEVNAEDVNF